MTARTTLRTLTAASALLAALAPATTFSAGGDGPYGELVHERHENFEEMGDAFKVIRDQLRGDAAVDFDAQTEAAAVIVGFSTEIPTWFPEGSGPQDGYDTDALAAIWEERAKFDGIAEDFAPKAAALQTAVASGELSEVGAAFRETGGTCKRCHDSFRAD